LTKSAVKFTRSQKNRWGGPNNPLTPAIKIVTPQTVFNSGVTEWQLALAGWYSNFSITQFLWFQNSTEDIVKYLVPLDLVDSGSAAQLIVAWGSIHKAILFLSCSS
jgi:hypothetical protein